MINLRRLDETTMTASESSLAHYSAVEFHVPQGFFESLGGSLDSGLESDATSANTRCNDMEMEPCTPPSREPQIE